MILGRKAIEDFQVDGQRQYLFRKWHPRTSHRRRGPEERGCKKGAARAMKIAILSRKATLYSTSRLIEACRQRGST